MYKSFLVQFNKAVLEAGRDIDEIELIAVSKKKPLNDIKKVFNEGQLSFGENQIQEIETKWISWLQRWREHVINKGDQNEISAKMKRINPKYTWREWLITPAYEMAEKGDYGLIMELQAVLDKPYEEQSLEVQKKYDRLKPKKFFGAGGISHYSCSS